MTQHPDKLFREGLGHYQKHAPVSAWDRIESGLDRKRKRSPWMKIAAGMLLVIASSVMFFLRETADVRSETADVRRETVDARRETADVRRETADARRETVDAGRETGEAKSEKRKAKSENKNPKSSRLQSTVYSPQSTVSSGQSAVGSGQSAVGSGQSAVGSGQSTVYSLESSTHTSEPVERNTEQPVAQSEITSEISPTDEALDSKGTSITYSVEEINAKYLKKESSTKATPEKKNASGLQKVIDLAMDLKTEGAVLGDFRDKKNDLLSFNLPSHKRETLK